MTVRRGTNMLQTIRKQTVLTATQVAAYRPSLKL